MRPRKTDCLSDLIFWHLMSVNLPTVSRGCKVSSGEKIPETSYEYAHNNTPKFTNLKRQKFWRKTWLILAELQLLVDATHCGTF